MNIKLLKNILAVFVMIGVASGVGLRLWSSSKLEEASVPTALERLDDTGKVMIATRKDLLIVDATGNLVTKISLSSLGINKTITDIQSMPDGIYLLAESGDGLVYKCSLNNNSCSVFIRPKGQSVDIQANSVKLAVDKSSKLIYVANPWKQKIEKFNFSGKYTGTLNIGDKSLLYPNDMWVLKSGRVVISDTNHHRVITSLLDDNKGDISSVDSVNFSTDGYPMEIVYFNDKWWIIEGSEMLTSSWISAYNATGKKLFTVNLDSNDDPVFLLPTSNGTLLAAIQSNARIAIITKKGEARGLFSGNGLRTYFEGVQNEQKLQKKIANVAWGVILVFVFLAMFVLYLERRETKI